MPRNVAHATSNMVGMDDLEAAWIDVHDANARLGWFVGRPAYEPRRHVPWSQYAFDPSERPTVSHRTREWTAVGSTEAACVRSMAQSLSEIAAGRVPR